MTADTRDYALGDPSVNPVAIPGQAADGAAIPATTNFFTPSYTVPANGEIVVEFTLDITVSMDVSTTRNNWGTALPVLELPSPIYDYTPYRFHMMVKAGDVWNMRGSGDCDIASLIPVFVQAVP